MKRNLTLREKETIRLSESNIKPNEWLMVKKNQWVWTLKHKWADKKKEVFIV